LLNAHFAFDVGHADTLCAMSSGLVPGGFALTRQGESVLQPLVSDNR